MGLRVYKVWGICPRPRQLKCILGPVYVPEEVPGAVFAPVDLTLGLATAPHSVTVGYYYLCSYI